MAQTIKASACNARDPSSIPESGRSPREGNGDPLQYSCLENSMDGGAWWATVHGVAKSQTRLSDFTFLLFFLCCHFPGQSSERPHAWGCVRAGRGPPVLVPSPQTTNRLPRDLAGSDRGQVRPVAFSMPGVLAGSDEPCCACCTV